MRRTCVLIVSMAMLWTGCGGGGGSSTAPAPSAAFKSPTNASQEAIDCQRERAYVPLQTLGPHAQVAVLDLSVDPDSTDPRLTTIDLGHGGVASSAAIAPAQGLALVVSGSVAANGFLDEINESDNTLVAGSPFSFPTGGRPIPSDGIVFDPKGNSALVSMTSTPVTCPAGSITACTGMASFDLTSNTFGPLGQFNNSVNNFGFDPRAQISLGPSDPIDPTVYAVNTAGNEGCTLTDDSLTALDDDPDGAGVDPNTGIWVVGQFAGPFTVVINLSGATFSGTPPSCTLDELGAPPSNSVIFATGTGDFQPGVAINPVTHQAVLTGLLDNVVSLVSLPKTRSKFIRSSDLRAVNASLPLEPDGLPFAAATFPYADAIDTCHNRVYILNTEETFLAEVDLEKLQKSPNAIDTALPAGNCAGTSTTLSCDNQNGVRFFPLPGV